MIFLLVEGLASMLVVINVIRVEVPKIGVAGITPMNFAALIGSSSHEIFLNSM
jgi:hypothetical protein